MWNVYFRARAGAAPLKHFHRRHSGEHSRRFPRPRGRGPVEASRRDVRREIKLQFPRPRGRGPVEAAALAADWNCQAVFPRPRGRGPVEAHFPKLTPTHVSPNFRARAGAAPLKLICCFIPGSRLKAISAPARARPR